MELGGALQRRKEPTVCAKRYGDELCRKACSASSRHSSSADSYVLVWQVSAHEGHWHVEVAVAACGASHEPPERGNVRGHCRERSRDLLCCLVTSDATMRFQDAGFKPRLK